MAQTYRQIKSEMAGVPEPFLIHSPAHMLLAGAWNMFRDPLVAGQIRRRTRKRWPSSNGQRPRAGLGQSFSPIPLSARDAAEFIGTWGIDFDVRVGITTGLVVVGPVGSDLHMEYTALGDTINLAARMEQTAGPGTVQIAEQTYKPVATLFEFEELGGLQLKGKAERVLAYRVQRSKTRRGRLRGVDGLDSPLVGRDAEMEALGHALTELQHGRGRVISLIGEAGLGKSRLMSELRARSLAEAGGASPIH